MSYIFELRWFKEKDQQKKTSGPRLFLIYTNNKVGALIGVLLSGEFDTLKCGFG